MAMKELLEYAMSKLDEACRGGTVVDINYWSGYCDGIRACIRETERLRIIEDFITVCR